MPQFRVHLSDGTKHDVGAKTPDAAGKSAVANRDGVKVTKIKRLKSRHCKTLDAAQAILGAAPVEHCVAWPLGAAKKPYPSMWVAGQQMSVHRYLCMEVNGPPVPPRTIAAHKCGVEWCVNPRHVRWATQQENMLDRNEHGTHFKGEKHPLAKLTAKDVVEIRALSGRMTQSAIGARFGIDQQQVSRIIRGISWREVSP